MKRENAFIHSRAQTGFYRWVRMCVYVLPALLGAACSEMGSQPPETEALILSADHRFIIRHYTVYYVHAYERKGGSTFRRGTTTHYLEKYDAQNGTLIGKSPGIKKNIYPIFVSGRLVWIRELNTKTGDPGIMALSTDDFREVFSNDAIVRANNGLRFVPHQAYVMKSDQSQIVLRGNDARTYKINEQTGAGQLVDAAETEIYKPDFLDNRWQSSGIRYQFSSGDRKYLTAKSQSGEKQSNEDFIRPEIVGTKHEGVFTPSTANDLWFVLSKTTTDNQGYFQLTAVDTATLATRWNAIMDFSSLPVETRLSNAVVTGDKLLIIEKKSMGMLDTKNGTWLWKFNQ